MLPPADAGGTGPGGPDGSRCWPTGSSGLSWRLRRAERLQAAAYDKIENQNESSQPPMPPEVASKMLAVLVESNWHPPAPAVTPSAFGRKAVQDFNLERVLDRLLVYERRIEHSLYRTMAELRKLRKEGGIAGSITSTGIPKRETSRLRVACPAHDCRTRSTGRMPVLLMGGTPMLRSRGRRDSERERGRIVRNEPNFRRSFKCEGGSCKRAFCLV